VVQHLASRVPARHIGLQTDEAQHFYRRLGFRPQPDFMTLVVGKWLDTRRTGDDSTGLSVLRAASRR